MMLHNQTLLLLVGFALCSCSEKGSGGEVSEGNYALIMAAVLDSRPDTAVQREAWLSVTPERRGWLDDWLDHRLCITRETAGAAGDFELRFEGRADTAASMRTEPPFDYRVAFPRRWERSAERRRMPAGLLPDHLRWDGTFSICPNGTLRFGNPVVDGVSARVYIENTSATHSMGGEVILERRGDGWQVVDERTYWLA